MIESARLEEGGVALRAVETDLRDIARSAADVVAPAELLSKAESLAAELAQAAPLAVSYAKRVIDGLVEVEVLPSPKRQR